MFRFGEKCCLEHDIPTFLAKKPADIGEICPLYESRGTCPFSYACRFGGAHTDAVGNQMSKVMYYLMTFISIDPIV